MNFALRRLPPLPSRRVLAGRYPRLHPPGRPLSSSARGIQTSSQPPPGSTHVASNGFPPLPSLPEAPAYPCPHLTNFDALKSLYQRHWKVYASYNNARGVRTVALEKKFTLIKYRHTLEFFNDVMGLEGICAQEKVNPSHTARGLGTNAVACSASPIGCQIYVHDFNLHLKDLECYSSPIYVKRPAFSGDNAEGYTLGYPHRETLRGQVHVLRKGARVCGCT